MEKAKNTSNLNIQLPPGFRFHPTDEELIVHYLQKKVSSSALPASIFAEIEIYKFNPWELPYKALFGEDEWYFFSPRDRKYPNGVRPNRMAGSGYWKATGTDRPILGSSEDKFVGVKKALVFYEGKPPRGNKTDWIMHEYRLLDSVTCSTRKPKESMRLDDWVLCRVRQKICTPRHVGDQKYDQSNSEPEKSTIGSMDINPNLEILKKENLFKDCPMLPFIFDSHLDFSYMETSFEGTRNSFISYENRGKIQESFDNTVSYDRKRKEINQEEAFSDSFKKLRTMESQSEEIGYFGMNTNEMMSSQSHGGEQYEMWKYMMGYRDLNHLTFM